MFYLQYARINAAFYVIENICICQRMPVFQTPPYSNVDYIVHRKALAVLDRCSQFHSFLLCIYPSGFSYSCPGTVQPSPFSFSVSLVTLYVLFPSRNAFLSFGNLGKWRQKNPTKATVKKRNSNKKKKKNTSGI